MTAPTPIYEATAHDQGRKTPAINRLVSKISETPTGCWEFQGAKTTKGYGSFFDGRRVVLAHRYAYEFFRHEIPGGLVIDHLCRNPPCVNPWHLEPVSSAENTRRGVASIVAKELDVVGQIQRSKTHCPKGHPYSPENTLYEGAKRVRRCRECRRLRHYADADRRQAARLAGLPDDDPRHGTSAGYRAYCRCGPCRATKVETNRRQYERRRQP